MPGGLADGASPRALSVAIVGAGWSGLAAAVELAAAGAGVTVFEAAPHAGGRARAVTLQMAGRHIELDNGQHLMMGAYRDVLRMVDRVTGDVRTVLERHPMDLHAADGLRMTAPRGLPAPLHLAAALATARGLSLRERIAMARAMLVLRSAGWQVPEGGTVAHLLTRMRQPASLVRRLWEPLCVGALNTRPIDACARSFVNVLRDTLGARAGDSDFILPRNTLSDVFPRPAVNWLRERGARVLTGTPVRELARAPSGWWVRSEGEPSRFDAVVLAVPAERAARLLPAALDDRAAALARTLASFSDERIATVYLAWPADKAPGLPGWTMLAEDDAGQSPGQWLFDRGQHQGLRIAAVVVSTASRVAAMTPDALGQAVVAQVARQVAEPATGHRVLPRQGRHGACAGSIAASDYKVIIDKRATFRCLPGRPELLAGSAIDAGLPALWMAGDHLLPGYPATLESAVRTGVAAARELLATTAGGLVP